MHVRVGWEAVLGLHSNVILYHTLFRRHLISSITEADQSFYILINYTAKARGASEFQAVIGV